MGLTLIETFENIQVSSDAMTRNHVIAILFAGGKEGQHSRESPEEPDAPRK